MKESEYITGFLAYMREVITRLNIATANELEANAQTQDILHRLETEDDCNDETARLGILLREVRRKRRVARDKREALTPIVDWLTNNGTAINSLDRTLGEVRKIEKRQGNRAYAPRTDILEHPATVETKEVEDHDL